MVQKRGLDLDRISELHLLAVLHSSENVSGISSSAIAGILCRGRADLCCKVRWQRHY